MGKKTAQQYGIDWFNAARYGSTFEDLGVLTLAHNDPDVDMGEVLRLCRVAAEYEFAHEKVHGDVVRTWPEGTLELGSKAWEVKGLTMQPKYCSEPLPTTVRQS